MSDKRQLGPVPAPRSKKPRLVVAGASGFLGKAGIQLRTHGWDVENVPAAEAVRATLTRKPNAILLPEYTNDESGYLIAAKLLEAREKLKVVLVGTAHSQGAERFAEFLGAQFVAESEGIIRVLAALEM